MKQIMILMLIILSSTLFSATLEVAADGSKPYTTIQSAINATSNGDIVQVYPGTYRENIDMSHHSITLQSLYANTQDTTIIHNTRIIGLPTTSAIQALTDQYNQMNITIDGFTIMNNEQMVTTFYTGGAGIRLRYCNATIRNNIITKSTAEAGGGGISISLSNAFLENNQIYNCWTCGNGGGIDIVNNSQVTFSQEHLNSIYNNHSDAGKDIYIGTIEANIDIYLDKCSRQLNAMDQFFIGAMYNDDGSLPNQVTVHTLQGTLPIVNHDLYVSPTGSDTNDGLTPEHPLATIDWATRIMYADSLTPHTIHLLAGTFSRSNGQLYPSSIGSYMHLMGAGMDETILDGEHIYRFVDVHNFSHEVSVTDLTITHCGSGEVGWVLGAGGVAGGDAKSNFVFRNIRLRENNLQTISGLDMEEFNQGIIENCVVEDYNCAYGGLSVSFYIGKKAIVNNITVNNLHSNATGGGNVQTRFDLIDRVIVNNFSMTNCKSFDAGLFAISFYDGAQTVGASTEPHILNNMLIANNNTTAGDWDLPKVAVYDTARTTIFNNCTFANNWGNHYMLGFSSAVELNNVICYNPALPIEVLIARDTENPVWLDFPVTINNSLIYGGMNRISLDNADPTQLQMNDVLEGSPQFKGQADSLLSPTTWAYYQLAEDSPCINAGTPDTTGLCLPRLDLAGCQRVWDGRIDMGCFEYGATGNEDHEITAVNDYGLTNFPNPMVASQNDATIISFNYPTRAEVEPEIEIYNAKGQKVRTLKTGVSFLDLMTKAGVGKESTQYVKGHNYSVVWDGRNENNHQVSSGVYLYRAKVGNKILQTKKLLILQ